MSFCLLKRNRGRQASLPVYECVTATGRAVHHLNDCRGDQRGVLPGDSRAQGQFYLNERGVDCTLCKPEGAGALWR